MSALQSLAGAIMGCWISSVIAVLAADGIALAQTPPLE
jgi:hypothetical protein